MENPVVYRCVIFDLDQTLIDTSELQTLRDNKKWNNIYEKKHLTTPYPGIHKLIEDLHPLHIKVTVATNTPAGYAKTLLKYHNINPDYLVTYHDVNNHKPDPECVFKICGHFNIHKTQILYIGDSDTDFYTAKHANVKFFGTPWGTFSNDTQTFNSYKNFISEVIDEEANKVLKKVEIRGDDTLVLQENNLFFLGYYVANGSKRCFQTVKKKLLNFKDDLYNSKKQWFNVVRNHINELPKIELIVRALGHNEEYASSNRIDKIAQLIANHNEAIYKPSLLEKFKIKKSTKLNKKERFSQIKGVYRISDPKFCLGHNREIDSILIIDDVYTTGATTNEIIRVLKKTFPKANLYIFTLTRTVCSEVALDKENHNLNLIRQLNNVNCTAVTQQRQKINHAIRNKYFTANYCYSNSNFVIQNLPKFFTGKAPLDQTQLSSIYVIRNMLCRGLPTLLSKYLQSHLGQIHKNTNFKNGRALYSSGKNKWERIFQDSNCQNAAQIFYEQLLDKYLDEYSYIKGLIIPEMRISDITLISDEYLHNQCVDFYLPQAFLVIEIDGPQHAQNQSHDSYRDFHLNKYGITTVRITTGSILSENNEFINKIDQIKHQISNWEERGLTIKQSKPWFISLNDYKNSFNTLSNDIYSKSTAIIRFQLLILELLEKGTLNFDNVWNFQIRTNYFSDFAELAIEDLFLWFSNMASLYGNDFKKSKYKITPISDSDNFSKNRDAIFIDFSLLKRWTDEFQDNPDIIYVRTHYLDHYKYFENIDSPNLQTFELKKYDYFSVSSLNRIDYPIDFSELDSIEKSLLFFLENLFLQDIPNLQFREGQLEIIINALSGNNTIGLLPTGSGKSVCYQLSAILQPAISFVVCPIKSLMYDQKYDLDNVFFSRVNFLTSDLTSPEKAFIQSKYAQGKYFFIFISPERFQSKAFRRAFSAINTERSLAYAVIDEVHCLSEWGHDFRTSYLNLANAIDRLTSNSRYIGLTATASVNVLRDIQKEFSISELDIKTPSEYTREELTFSVIDDQGNKYSTLLNCIHSLDQKFHFLSDVDHSKCGLIFSSVVNGKKGCYAVSQQLEKDLEVNVGFFSGSQPKNYHKSDFDSHKRDIQNGFKNNQFPLLVATKAFGMGVNKGNIYFTIHYGIPSSMEALYQEAGRAGRNKELFQKNQAECIVLLGTETDINPQIWSPEITVEELSKEVKSLIQYNDLSTNFFLFLQGTNPIKDDFIVLKSLYSDFYIPKKLTQIIHSKKILSTKQKVEKSIYRLSQLGIVQDWTVENFYQGIFEVEFVEHNDDYVRNFLINNIHKYDPKFSFDDIPRNGSYMLKHVYERFDSIELYFLILLIWSYEHFAYNRRQSLKNVYENCIALSSNKITKDRFKTALEDYFKFDSSSNLLQRMADNPLEHDYWFSIYFETFNGIQSETIVNKRRLRQLKGQLSRFLESYMSSTSLNVSSGFIRLLLNEYDDPDGENRMVMALKDIQNSDEIDKIKITDKIFDFVSKLKEDIQDRFIDTFYEVFRDIPLLKRYEERLGNLHFTYLIMADQVQQLENINNQIRSLGW